MRLIEEEALERVLSEQITDDRGGNLTVEDIANNEAIVDTMRIIHEQPTVNAIPVEWINKYANEHRAYIHVFAEMVVCWYERKET